MRSERYNELDKKSDLINKLSSLMIYFTLYSMIGWIYEVFLEVVVYRWGFSNRGVLTGPYLPVYGFGALVFLLLVYPIIRNKPIISKIIWMPVVFLLCMAIATAIELGTSYILEYLTGSWPWQTYADYAINFQARIALSPSVRFGIGGVFFLYVLQPLFEKLSGKMSDKSRTLVALILLLIFVVDFLHTILFK
ncbi:MAG: putative ABC transporter permease [Mogibacterium sp.]|nr:putative ABC transporter permease [Mogibacterium sp.]